MSQSLPKTYKAIEVQSKGGDFKIVDKDLKLPAKNEVLVKVQACGICHSDSLSKDGIYPIKYPIVPGHEVVGKIVAVGDDAKEWKVGDRVGTGWEGGHCNACIPCRKGAFVSCDNGTINGVFKAGGYAEYCIIRKESVVRVPEELDAAEVAPLLCAGVTVFNSMRNTPAHAGDVVAIQGIGGLGHLAIQYARAMGFYTVALSTSDDKKELAMKLGANEFIGTKDVKKQVEGLQKLGGAKIILATAPHADSIGPMTDGLGLDGTLLVVAAAGPVTVNTNTMIAKRVALRAWASGSAIDSEETIKFAQHSGIKCHVERFKMNDVEKGYEKMMTNKARFRSVLVFE
ncbi:GroES-like protein [Powellomyces hirtus]|nr:GroES-like protein [Powellomyces hirtus]